MKAVNLNSNNPKLSWLKLLISSVWCDTHYIEKH